MAKVRPINLLPQEEFEASVLGRVLRWAMGTFRIIVIVTEMIVMTAFLSRFWLDAQNSDLTDQVRVESAQITSQADFEKQFRDLQTKLKTFNDISKASQYSNKLDLIVAKIPAEVTLTSLALSPDSSVIKGDSGTETGIAQLLSNLRAEPSFKQVELGSLGSSETNTAITTFSIKITY